jgi:hypothetical protein
VPLLGLITEIGFELQNTLSNDAGHRFSRF